MADVWVPQLCLAADWPLKVLFNLHNGPFLLLHAHLLKLKCFAVFFSFYLTVYY